MLVNEDGTPNHPEPPGPLIDLEELKLADGWMRATAPAGRAAYEGIEAWTPSAGVGLRPAEAGQSTGTVNEDEPQVPAPLGDDDHGVGEAE